MKCGVDKFCLGATSACCIHGMYPGLSRTVELLLIDPEEVGQLLAKHHGKFACALLIGFIHALTSER